MRKHHYVVVYDIADNANRKKVSDALESLGDRVNLSVFECPLSEQELEPLLQKLTQFIDRRTDTLIFYPLCLNCRSTVRSAGRKIERKMEQSLLTA